MNRPPESFVRVREDRLLDFAKACFEKAGLDADHAGIIARLLVNSDLRGVRSHGTRTVNGYCKSFENGHANPRPNVRVLHETPTCSVIDGDGTLGYLPMVRAAEHAIRKAEELGMGMGLARHIGHIGSAGHYARMCSEAGCIGFCVQGKQHGKADDDSRGRQLGYFGNPPICFALPSGDEPPVVLDAATCILADYQRGGNVRRPARSDPGSVLQEYRVHGGCGTHRRGIGWRQSAVLPCHRGEMARNGRGGLRHCHRCRCCDSGRDLS